MKIVNPRFRVLTYFCFALLSVIVQRVVHYFLIAGGYKKAADFFDVLLWLWLCGFFRNSYFCGRLLYNKGKQKPREVFC